jgi:WD40 repeat protein
MPGEPTAETKTFNNPPVAVQMQKYTVFRANKKRLFMVYYIDFPPVVRQVQGPDGILRLARDDALQSSKGGEILSEHAINLGNASGREIATSVSGMGKAVNRYFVSGNRLYAVTVVMPTHDSTWADATRFFDSFRIDPPAAPPQQPSLKPRQTEQLAPKVAVENSVANDSIEFRGLPNEVRSLAFTADGKTLLAASGSAIFLLDLGRREVSGTLANRDAWIPCLALSPDGQWVAAAAEDGPVDLWDLHKRTLVRSFPPGGSGASWSVAFSPDSRTVAAGYATGGIKLWDRESGEERPFPIGTLQPAGKEPVRCLAFTPDGRCLAAAPSGPFPGISFLDVHTGRLSITYPQTREVTLGSSFALSSDGKRMVHLGEMNEIHLRDLSTQKPIFSTPGRGTCLALSPDGRRIAVGNNESGVQLYDGSQGKSQGMLRGHKGSVCFVAFSHDASTLAVGSLGEVRLWDLERAK